MCSTQTTMQIIVKCAIQISLPHMNKAKVYLFYVKLCSGCLYKTQECNLEGVGRKYKFALTNKNNHLM